MSTSHLRHSVITRIGLLILVCLWLPACSSDESAGPDKDASSPPSMSGGGETGDADSATGDETGGEPYAEVKPADEKPDDEKPPIDKPKDDNPEDAKRGDEEPAPPSTDSPRFTSERSAPVETREKDLRIDRGKFVEMKVYYATNRLPNSVLKRTWSFFFVHYFMTIWGLVVAVLSLLAGYCALKFWNGWTRWLSATALLLTAPLVLGSAYARQQYRAAHEGPGPHFTSGRNSHLELGYCYVSIPKESRPGVPRQPGEMNRPRSVARIEIEPENPVKHISILRIQPLSDSDYYRKLKADLGQSSNELLVFIHGYSNTFDDAARRTAQICHDLDYAGVPVCFSWPTSDLTLAYTHDENEVEIASVRLREFLSDLHRKSGAKRIHVLAHSMGNRVMAQAMEFLFDKSDPEFKPAFDEVILAAPDIDGDAFRERYAGALKGLAKRVTLYVSQHDRALGSSTGMHGGTHGRAGEAGEDLVIVDGIDTIDVSSTSAGISLFHHTYYGDNVFVIDDIAQMIRDDLCPAARKNLKEQTLGEDVYWVFSPAD